MLRFFTRHTHTPTHRCTRGSDALEQCKYTSKYTHMRAHLSAYVQYVCACVCAAVCRQSVDIANDLVAFARILCYLLVPFVCLSMRKLKLRNFICLCAVIFNYSIIALPCVRVCVCACECVCGAPAGVGELGLWFHFNNCCQSSHRSAHPGCCACPPAAPAAPVSVTSNRCHLKSSAWQPSFRCAEVPTFWVVVN